MKKLSFFLTLGLAASFAGSAVAEPALIGAGSLDSSRSDASAQTAGALENGVPGNLLGGTGSGLEYAGAGVFLALPDRGPNATPYSKELDDTASYVPRFHTLSIALAPSAPGSALPVAVTPKLAATTLLYSASPLAYSASGAPKLNAAAGNFYFSGRSDNFDAAGPSTNPKNGRLDPEGIRVSPDGNTVYVTDEYGPYVYAFNRKTGERTKAFAVPDKFAVSKQLPSGDGEISGNASGRVANKGMEGLALTPGGKKLVGVMQSPLLQDGGTSAAVTRILVIDAVTGATAEYAYALDNIGSAAKPKYSTVSEILAINDHEFLVDERDGKGFGDNSSAACKKVYRIDLAGAKDVGALAGEAALAPNAVKKTLFLDIVLALGERGYKPADIPAKLEGMAFGPDVTVGNRSLHTLFVSNDNDYLSVIKDASHPDGTPNPDLFFVFGFTDSDLGGFVADKK